MDFSNLSVGNIVQLIQGGYISEPSDVVAAHDEILQKIIFNEEIIDMEYFEKLSSVVAVLRDASLPNTPLVQAPASYEDAIKQREVAHDIIPPASESADINKSNSYEIKIKKSPSKNAKIRQNIAVVPAKTSTNNLLPSLAEGVPSTSRTVPTLQQHLYQPSTRSRADRVDRMLYAPQNGDGERIGEGERFQYFDLLSEGVKRVKKFNTEARTINFSFKEADEEKNPVVWLRNAFAELISHVTKNASPNDRIGMVITNDNFADKPIGISFRRVDQLSADVVMVILEKVLQSNARFFARDMMRLRVDRVEIPTGYGRQRLTGTSFEEFCRRKQGILQVENHDNRCLAKALVLAMAHRRKEDLIFYRDGGVRMERETDELCARAGVDLSNGGTREHIDQFQQYLAGYTIVVYDSRTGNSVYYEGPRAQDRVVLNLIMENEHYNVISNFTSAFTCSYYCELCRRRFNNKAAHRHCKYTCPCCHANPPCNINQNLIKCDRCNRDFRGDVCFEEHKKGLCKVLRRCQSCLATVWIDGKDPHKCGYKRCAVCQAEKPFRHLCYMPKNKPSRDRLTKKFIFVFYDFECMQNSVYNELPNTYLHVPNLCVAQNICNFCIENGDIEQPCEYCGRRQHVFREDPVKELLNYISNLAGKECSVTALAHNMKGYDGSFILQAVLREQERWNPNIVLSGTKIMSLKCNNIKFIDSLNFMPLPLAKLPKTFDFPGGKGHFPHLFNTPETQNYVGPLPDPKYYMADDMSTKARCDFYAWYNAEVARNVVFNFKEEIVKYCVDDVNILRKACIEFWKRYTTSNGIDPFREACTIAGCASLVYRRNFLEENTIAILPHGGYRMADKQSNIAIKWLLWLEHSENIQIQHAGNAREARLREGMLVDGFCAETNTVYNFHGCYWHGCEKCYPDQVAELSKVKGETMFARRERTEAMAARIRSHRYNLVEMWECEFKQLLKFNQEAENFVNNHELIKNAPLNPRDCFFGGRTNAVKLHHKVVPGEKIKYLDVCSLYPFSNKYGKYPVGHPTIHVGEEECRRVSLDTVEGIIKCTVLPPSNLYHPVLPMKMHGKLMFILCRACGETLNQSDCTHTEDERKFTGTYVADELRKAIEKGYRVLELQEIWEYKVTQYDRRTRSGGLFAGYVDNFLKIKQECSGYPSWCLDDQSKDQYIRNYLENEGVELEKDKVSNNPGMRYIAKLNLNSFWGKFAQRENLPQTSIISDPQDFFKLMTDPSVEVQSLITIDEKVIVVNWKRTEEGVTPLNTVNIVLAAYTTANARLELYKYLEKLGSRVLYFDTDSVIFTEKEGEWSPPVGDYLGDMTDEMAEYGAGSYIIEFVSGGPKNYAFKLFSTKENREIVVCKVKGITLNYKNSKFVNFNKLKFLVLNDIRETYVETDRRISRTPTYDVISKPEKKVFRVQYTKRRRVENSYDTLPYGFRE